jgi:DNA-binding SARP family transcriptional activator
LLGEAERILGERTLRPEQVRALVLRADALWRLNREARALRCLEQAATLALDRGWLGGLVRDAEPALIGLRALASHWRLHGKARQLVDRLLASGTRPRVRLMVPPSTASDPEEEEAPDQEVLRFSPFGEGALYQGSVVLPLSRLGGEKARELLAFALWKARPLGREEILDALWDGESTSRTRAALRMATYQLRRLLGADGWTLTSGEHALMAVVDDDLRTLLALAVSIDDPQAAPTDLVDLGARGLALYRGAYLPWCGSAWAEGPRQMATTAVLSIAQCLIAARRRLGHLTAALEAAEHGLRIEPAHDGLRQTQIQLLAEMGRPGEAVESYRRYRRLLDDEGLGSPSPELRAFITSLRRG